MIIKLFRHAKSRKSEFNSIQATPPPCYNSGTGIADQRVAQDKCKVCVNEMHSLHIKCIALKHVYTCGNLFKKKKKKLTSALTISSFFFMFKSLSNHNKIILKLIHRGNIRFQMSFLASIQGSYVGNVVIRCGVGSRREKKWHLWPQWCWWRLKTSLKISETIYLRGCWVVGRGVTTWAAITRVGKARDNL